MKNYKSTFFAAVLCAVALLVPSRGFSQTFDTIARVDGEAIKGSVTTEDENAVGVNFIWTSKCIYRATRLHSTFKFDGYKEVFSVVGLDLTIVEFRILQKDKYGKGGYHYQQPIFVLSDGAVYDLPLNGPASEVRSIGKIDLSANETSVKLMGDALYALTTQNIFVSRDTGYTWTTDTAGLSGQAQDIAVDTEQYAYAVKYNALFRQNPDTNIWRSMTIPGNGGWNKIYVDRLDHLYLGGAFSGRPVIYRSTDRGTTWTVDTAGLGKGSMFSFGDDAYGNVYAITAFSSAKAGDQMYRSNGGAWTRIDLPITGGNIDSLNGKGFFTDVGGDSILVATSNYGVFSSTDQGATWTESNDGIAAEHFYGLVQTPSKRMLTSTSLGVFGINANDTAWTKSYPKNGYLGGQPLLSDNSGAIYTLGPLVAAPSSFTNPYPPRITMKSTDSGVTWQPDTLGLAAMTNVRSNLFFVDETGTQHIAGYYGTTAPSSMYAKQPGQRWAGDTAGFAAPPGLPQAFGSDGRGNLYMSIGSTPSLWRRAVTGGAWASDTAGLGMETLNSFAAAKDGSLYAGGFAAVWKRTASRWTYIPPPTGIYPGATAYSISIDSTGALIAGYQHFDANYNSIGDGVFATTNDGKTWTNLGHVDTTTFIQFTSYGDTTYGLSYYDGMFVFTTGASSAVLERQAPETLQLDLYPNPVQTSMTIELKNARPSNVEVFDLLGNLLRTFSGQGTATWDGRDAEGRSVPNSAYIIRVTGLDQNDQSFRASKLVVIGR